MKKISTPSGIGSKSLLTGICSSDWVLVTDNRKFTESREFRTALKPWTDDAPRHLAWTDDFSSLYDVIE